MFDFGLARQYTTVTGEVRQPRQVAGFRGTVRYASLNAHLSRDLGRHDDLWSVFYLLVELAVGQLPWRRIRDKEEAGEVKAKFDHCKLLQGLPPELGLFLDHIKLLTYYDKPDYVYVSMALKKAIARLGIQENDPFDWEQDLCGPSITSASAVSTPGVKAVSRDAVKHSVHKSRTNCSEVEDLIENNSPVNQLASQKLEDKVNSNVELAADYGKLPTLEQWMPQKKGTMDMTVDKKKSKEAEQHDNEDIMDKKVQIENYYISEDQEDDEEENGSNSQGSSSRESTQSDSSDSSQSDSSSAHDVRVEASVPVCEQGVRKKQVVNYSPTSQSSRSNEDHNGELIETDSLKKATRSENNFNGQMQSITTTSRSSNQIKQQQDSNSSNKCKYVSLLEKEDPDVYPDCDQPVMVGFRISSVNQESLKNAPEKEAKRRGSNIVRHSVDQRTDSSSYSSKSVGVNLTTRMMSSLPTQFNAMIVTSENKEAVTKANKDGGDLHRNSMAHGTNRTSRVDNNERSDQYLDGESPTDVTKTREPVSKQIQDRKAAAPLKDTMIASSQLKLTKKNFPAKAKAAVSSTKKPQKAGYSKVRASELKTTRELRSNEQSANMLELVPSPVVLQPRPPPNPPPQHYTHTLQGRRRRFTRPQAEK